VRGGGGGICSRVWWHHPSTYQERGEGVKGGGGVDRYPVGMRTCLLSVRLLWQHQPSSPVWLHQPSPQLARQAMCLVGGALAHRMSLTNFTLSLTLMFSNTAPTHVCCCRCCCCSCCCCCCCCRYSQGLAARGELLQDIRVLMSQRQAGPRKSVLDFMLEGKAERAQVSENV